MIKKLLSFCVCVMLCGSFISQAYAQNRPPANMPPARGQARDNFEYQFILNCLKEVARDPGSVVTRNIGMIDKNYWGGQVNWRNAFGGMTGWTHFTAALVVDGRMLVITIGGEMFNCPVS